nr:MAG TPA: hypothetical protein [Caudoviricetes sp.]
MLPLSFEESCRSTFEISYLRGRYGCGAARDGSQTSRAPISGFNI